MPMIKHIVEKSDWFNHGEVTIDFLWALRKAKIITEVSLQHVHNNSTWWNVDKNDWEFEQQLSHVVIEIDARDPNAKR